MVSLGLLAEPLAPRLVAGWRRAVNRRRRAPSVGPVAEHSSAERRGRELLEAAAGEETGEMYRALGFVRVWAEGGQAYLIYPHAPFVSYRPASSQLLAEHRLELGGENTDQLSDADDVLTRWLALSREGEWLLAPAVAQPIGHHHDRVRLARDLWRLGCWERGRGAAAKAQAD